MVRLSLTIPNLQIRTERSGLNYLQGTPITTARLRITGGRAEVAAAVRWLISGWASTGLKDTTDSDLSFPRPTHMFPQHRLRGLHLWTTRSTLLCLKSIVGLRSAHPLSRRVRKMSPQDVVGIRFGTMISPLSWTAHRVSSLHSRTSSTRVVQSAAGMLPWTATGFRFHGAITLRERALDQHPALLRATGSLRDWRRKTLRRVVCLLARPMASHGLLSRARFPSILCYLRNRCSH